MRRSRGETAAASSANSASSWARISAPRTITDRPLTIRRRDPPQRFIGRLEQCRSWTRWVWDDPAVSTDERLGDARACRSTGCGPLPAQHGRGRRADRPRPRVRDLRRVPHAHGAQARQAVGQRGAGPAGVRAQRAPRPRPGHSRPGRGAGGGPRRPRHRQGRPGRELDGLPDRPRGGARGARARAPSRPGLARGRRAEPAADPCARPAGEGRDSGRARGCSPSRCRTT